MMFIDRDIYPAFVDRPFTCPKCQKALTVIVTNPVQHLGDASIGYNNAVTCECGFSYTLGYNGGWGANSVVVGPRGKSYYGMAKYEWHHSGVSKSWPGTIEGLHDWIQTELDKGVSTNA